MKSVGEHIQDGLCAESNLGPCFWCSGKDRDLVAERGDGVQVLECRSCGHRAVDAIRIDLDEVYRGDSYFQKQTGSTAETTRESSFGYNNYQETSFADWNAEFFSALFLLDDLSIGTKARRVLDVGCATGTFLDMAKSFGHKTFGVEPSTWAQKICIEKGHQIAASTVETFDASQTEADLVTAFHVVEHLVDLTSFFDVISRSIESGSKFLAVFPHVNFQQENWSGKHDSFEHISFFSPDFVDKEFRKRLPEQFEVLNGPDLIFCFAGNLSPAQRQTISLIREISGKFADKTMLENGDPLARQQRCAWLFEQLKSTSLQGLVFVINFLARNHSACLAKEILEAVRNLPQWQQEPNWLYLCYGLVGRQNGNVYTTANYLGKLVQEHAESGGASNKGIDYVKDLVQGELPGLLRKKADEKFPVVSIWVNNSKGNVDVPALLNSIGEQTYPYIQVLLLGDSSQQKLQIPKQYQELVCVVETTNRSDSEIWLEASEESLGESVLLTNGQYRLSEHCIFAMYYPLAKSPDSIITAGVRDSIAEPVKMFSGQRLIERIIGRPLSRAKDSSKAPPFVMFNRNKTSWSDVDLDIVGDPLRFKKYLEQKSIVACPDVLGWLR